MLYLGLTSPLGRPRVMWWTFLPSHKYLCGVMYILVRFLILAYFICYCCFPLRFLSCRVNLCCFLSLYAGTIFAMFLLSVISNAGTCSQ